MSNILTVQFTEGELVEQLFQLKVSALRNGDVPELWRLTPQLLELALTSARTMPATHWPAGYVSESRLFNTPLDIVGDMPHLLCYDYVIYPYVVTREVLRPH